MAIQQPMDQWYFQDINLTMTCITGPRGGTGTGEGNYTPPQQKAVTNPVLLEIVRRKGRYENHYKKQINTHGTFQMFPPGRGEKGVLQDPRLLPRWPSVVVRTFLPFSQMLLHPTQPCGPPLQIHLSVLKLCDECMKWTTSFHKLAPSLKVPLL